MKNRFRLLILIMVSAFLCLLLAQAAPATTYTYSGLLKTLYIDGNLISVGFTSQPLSCQYCCLTIGDEGNRNYLYNAYDGNIAEFAIYAYDLNSTQIQNHYSQTTEAAYSAAVMIAAPLLYFRFHDSNDNNGAIVTNSSGTGDVNGTYIGNNHYIVVGGGPFSDSNAARFNPADGCDCIDVYDGTQRFFPNNGCLTVELWVDVNTLMSYNYQRLFQHNGGTTEQHGYGARFSYAGNHALGVIGGDNTSIFSLLNTNEANDINDGQWHHLVFVYQSIIGASDGATSYSQEVMNDDPCLYLRFGDDVNKDSSGHNYWVEYGSGTSIVTQSAGGGIGNCIYLPGGGGSYVAASNQTVPPLPSGNMGHQYAFASNDITFEYWIRSSLTRDAINSYACMFQQCMTSFQYEMNSPALAKNADQTYRWLYSWNGGGTSGGDWSYAYAAEAASTFPFDDKWHLIDFSYHEQDGGNPYMMRVRLCVDGNSVLEERLSTYPYPAQVGGAGGNGYMDHLIIGGEGYRTNVQNRWGGYYDEFAIYQGVLPAARILAHYAAGQPHNCSEVWSRGNGHVDDRNKDCYLDFDDFASFATDWRKCNDPCDPKCAPNWPH